MTYFPEVPVNKWEQNIKYVKDIMEFQNHSLLSLDIS